MDKWTNDRMISDLNKQLKEETKVNDLSISK